MPTRFTEGVGDRLGEGETAARATFVMIVEARGRHNGGSKVRLPKSRDFKRSVLAHAILNLLELSPMEAECVSQRWAVFERPLAPAFFSRGHKGHLPNCKVLVDGKKSERVRRMKNRIGEVAILDDEGIIVVWGNLRSVRRSHRTGVYVSTMDKVRRGTHEFFSILSQARRAS